MCIVCMPSNIASCFIPLLTVTMHFLIPFSSIFFSVYDTFFFSVSIHWLGSESSREKDTRNAT